MSADGTQGPDLRDWPVGLPTVVSGVRLTGGQIGVTWRATLTNRREVVVKQRPYPAEVEADGLAALAAAGVPVPEVLGPEGGTPGAPQEHLGRGSIDPDTDAQDRTFAVCAGRTPRSGRTAAVEGLGGDRPAR